MGLTDGMTSVEAAWLMLLYALPVALLIALVVVAARWVRRHDGEFSASEPGDFDPEEHHEPPQ